jgi:hypothetical protein
VLLDAVVRSEKTRGQADSSRSRESLSLPTYGTYQGFFEKAFVELEKFMMLSGLF